MRDPDGREFACKASYLEGPIPSTHLDSVVGVHQENSITVNWILDCGVVGGVEAHDLSSLPALSF